MANRLFFRLTAAATLFLFGLFTVGTLDHRAHGQATPNDLTATGAVQLVGQGRQTFRFDTFGDHAFWGDTLKLHQAIEGAAHNGVGPGLTPANALGLGLKVDVDALPSDLLQQLLHGGVNLRVCVHCPYPHSPMTSVLLWWPEPKIRAKTVHEQSAEYLQI